MPFRDIAGHRRLLALLSRAIARDSLPPSLIFAGPAGIGKRRAAIATAQALNCLAPVTGDALRVPARGGRSLGQLNVERRTEHVEPRTENEEHGTDVSALAVDGCGRCAACRRIAAGTHPDVLVIEPEETGNIRIAAVREAIERTGYRPFEGRRRVTIVDEADAMGEDAQDAFLKSLEEPPPSSVFILVTARPDVLLPTIRSRCARLRFGHLPQTGEASEEDLEARSVAFRLLSEVAGGADPVRRLRSARELAAHQDDKKPSAAVREKMGVELRALASLLRDVGILSTRADGPLANADLREALQRLAGAYSGERAVRAFAAVDRALGALERNNASGKVVADWLSLQL